MEIADKQTLSVLLTSLYVAKWESDEGNAHVAELSGSPSFARLYNDAVDEMIRLEAGRPDVVQSWQRWRAIETHPDPLERTRHASRPSPCGRRGRKNRSSRCSSS